MEYPITNDKYQISNDERKRFGHWIFGIGNFPFSGAGFTLVEVLIAFSILSIVIAAMGSTITSSLNNAQAAKNKTLATKYAQEGLEAVRGLRNVNYSGFRIYSGTYCLGILPPVLDLSTTCNTPNVATFIRTVSIEQSGCGLNVSKVTVVTSWTDGSCSSGNLYCHNASHSTCLSTINPLQAP